MTAKEKSAPWRRGGGPKGLATVLPRAARRLFKRRGFAQTDVLTRWPAIVGQTLAGHCQPERISWPPGKSADAVLRLRVAPAWAPEVQHLAPIILERVNAYFGYRAVTELRLTQGALPVRPVRPRARRRQLSPAERAGLGRHLGLIHDDELRQALTRLGETILSEIPPDKTRPPEN